MNIYEKLGIKPIINALGTNTKVGGSIVSQSVRDAMSEAALYNVLVADLERLVSKRIAELTRNEATFICAGAAAGVVLATAACMTGTDKLKAQMLPNTTGMPNEILVHRSHRNPYELQVLQAGAKLKGFGYVNESHSWQLEGAISDKTAAVLYFFFRGGHSIRGASLPLETVIEIAHSKGIPVIVDAAAQIPPVANLWEFTQKGADLVIFSGGKGLGGPQGSGLILGKKELIEACRVNGSPNYAIGRSMKTTKEEMVGLLVALEEYLNLDHDSIKKGWEEQIKFCVEVLGTIANIKVSRGLHNGQSIPVCLIKFEGDNSKLICKNIINRLAEWEPPIIAKVDDCYADMLVINPCVMKLEEMKIVTEALEEILSEEPILDIN